MALIGVTLEPVPTIRALKIWERPIHDEMWRVPYAELDLAVRELIDEYKVRQIGCDPFFLGQLMQEWADSGFPVLEIPTNSVPRAVSATKRFEDALMEGRFRQDGDSVMRRHLQNCVPKRDRHGLRVVRDRGNPVGFIDAGIGAIFGYDMASKELSESTLWLY
jgi:phage terminase large subunit-like protein